MVSKSLLVLRITAGSVFIMAGYTKIFGAITIPGFTQGLIDMGIPMAATVAWFVALLELVGGIALLLGIYTRFFASLLAIQMLGVFIVASEGYDVIALFGSTVALALSGSGKWAMVKDGCRGKFHGKRHEEEITIANKTGSNV